MGRKKQPALSGLRERKGVWHIPITLQDANFKHPKQSTRVYDMNTTSWQNARKKLNLPVRIYDLKHTFGRRLRAADVSEENRRDLLGHKPHRITTHYSAAEIRNLIDAAKQSLHSPDQHTDAGTDESRCDIVDDCRADAGPETGPLERNWKHIPANFRHGIFEVIIA